MTGRRVHQGTGRLLTAEGTELAIVRYRISEDGRQGSGLVRSLSGQSLNGQVGATLTLELEDGRRAAVIVKRASMDPRVPSVDVVMTGPIRPAVAGENDRGSDGKS